MGLNSVSGRDDRHPCPLVEGRWFPMGETDGISRWAVWSSRRGAGKENEGLETAGQEAWDNMGSGGAD
jgi:hypothetical protein